MDLIVNHWMTFIQYNLRETLRIFLVCLPWLIMALSCYYPRIRVFAIGVIAGIIFTDSAAIITEWDFLLRLHPVVAALMAGGITMTFYVIKFILWRLEEEDLI